MGNTFANREVCNLIFENYSNKVPFLNMDYANVSTTEVTGETVFAYGGQGHPKRVSFSGERGGTLTIETQIQSFKLYELLTGGTVSNTAKFIKREVLAASSDSITLSSTPASGATVNVFAENDDCGTPITITVVDKVVTLPASSTGNFVAYYLTDISSGVQKIAIKSTSFPKAFTVYGDTIMKTEDDQILPYKFVAYKVVPQSNMSIGMSNTGDPASITITCDLMVNEAGDLLDLILEEE